MPEEAESRGPIISARNLVKCYGALTAVQNVSFDIRPGQVLGVLGPNGSGKSTIVKMVTGLLDPTQGHVLFRGQNIREGLLDYRQSLAYVPEQSDLYGFLRGWEYVEMVAALRGLNMCDARDTALTLFQAFGLSEARGQLISSYSKGMRQRVVLISALIHNPQFLVLDEPFSGLDADQRHCILRRLIELLALYRQGHPLFVAGARTDGSSLHGLAAIALGAGGGVRFDGRDAYAVRRPQPGSWILAARRSSEHRNDCRHHSGGHRCAPGLGGNLAGSRNTFNSGPKRSSLASWSISSGAFSMAAPDPVLERAIWAPGRCSASWLRPEHFSAC